jgi:hypothetical protein
VQEVVADQVADVGNGPALARLDEEVVQKLDVAAQDVRLLEDEAAARAKAAEPSRSSLRDTARNWQSRSRRALFMQVIPADRTRWLDIGLASPRPSSAGTTAGGGIGRAAKMRRLRCTGSAVAPRVQERRGLILELQPVDVDRPHAGTCWARGIPAEDHGLAGSVGRQRPEQGGPGRRHSVPPTSPPREGLPSPRSVHKAGHEQAWLGSRWALRLA